MARVLVIDDDEQLRSAVLRALARAGHDVVTAPDVAAALRLQQEALADLIVTDIYMPGEDGMQAIRRFRQMWPTVKILAMSGGVLAGPADLGEHALLLGANAVLAKPFEVSHLLATARQLLR